MERGTQIAYVPDHANGDIEHPDVEFGFITEYKARADEVGYYSFCRYWRKGEPGTLRTMANSELTTSRCLVEYESVPQEIVDKWIELELEKG